MTKITKNFRFIHQLKNSTVSTSGWKYNFTELLITGVGYDHRDREERFSVDLETIEWDGKDLLPLFDNADCFDDLMDEIYTASCEHISGLFTEKEMEAA